MLSHIINTTFLDAPTSWQIGFQDPATPIINGIIYFHNHLIYYLLVIGTFVVFLLFRAWTLFKTNTAKPSPKLSKFTHSTPLEVIWTMTPALLLILIAGPSFALLYSIDEGLTPQSSLKVIGHQWYWSYEYGDFFNKESGKTINFDSYIVGEDDLSFGGLRLLEVDNRVKLPTNQHIRVLVSSADVLHSWAVPSLGIKIDACPGRLNQVSLILLRKGTFYGQCSEICGVNHGFIPIVVEGVQQGDYLSWVKTTHLGGTLVSPLNLTPRRSNRASSFRSFSTSPTLLVEDNKRGFSEVGVFPSASGGDGGEDPKKHFMLPKGHAIQPRKKSRMDEVTTYDSDTGSVKSDNKLLDGEVQTPSTPPHIEVERVVPHQTYYSPSQATGEDIQVRRGNLRLFMHEQNNMGELADMFQGVLAPVVEPVVQPVVEPVVEPVVQPVVEPVVQPVVEPVVQPVVEPVVQPVVEQVGEPVGEPVVAGNGLDEIFDLFT